MSSFDFPDLEFENFSEYRDTIHFYSKVLGNIRAAYTPPIKHHWHISLRIWAQGFTTTPVPTESGNSFQLFLNLLRSKVEIATSSGKYAEIDIEDQSQKTLAEQIIAELSKSEINISIDIDSLGDKKLVYSQEVSKAIFNAYSLVDMTFKEFRSNLPEQCSPVQIWPHHFDIAFNWFSGRKIPGEDPDDLESSSEQVGYGFILGDSAISDPYFYVLPYPQVDLEDKEFLHGGLNYTESWNGVLLKYESLLKAENPKQNLLEFLTDVHRKIKTIYL